MNKIYWLSGESGSGKTTLARLLAPEIDAVILDGDSMRASISVGFGFSKEDRRKHNLNVARLANVLSKQKTVVVSVIAPQQEVRDEIDKICSPVWIYVKRKMPKREGHFYEEPIDCITVDSDKNFPKENVAIIKNLIIDRKKYSFFVGRWQCLPIHDGHKKLFDIVRKRGRNILIGIRNGEIGKNNPYSVGERIESIKKEVPDADVIVLPDIEGIYYGRNVGYNIEQIELDKKTEKISATKIRNLKKVK